MILGEDVAEKRMEERTPTKDPRKKVVTVSQKIASLKVLTLIEIVPSDWTMILSRNDHLTKQTLYIIVLHARN